MNRKSKYIKTYTVGILLLFLSLYVNTRLLAQTIFEQTGIATYYSDRFHGRKTTSGKRYSKYKLTAAHNSIPLNSKVRVTNLKNNKSVIVTVNDRFRHSDRVIIDLSKAAARKIGIKRMGSAKVKIETLEEFDKDKIVNVALNKSKKKSKKQKDKKEALGEKQITDSTTLTDEIKIADIELSQGSYNKYLKKKLPEGYGVQIAIFKKKSNLTKTIDKYSKKYKDEITLRVIIHKGQRYYKIIIGETKNKKEAEILMKKLRKDGFRDCFVVNFKHYKN